MSTTMIVTRLKGGADARRRLLSELARGEAVAAVFFFSDGVDAAITRDERHAWQALAKRHRLALILCSASALRRGIASDDGSGAPDGFEVAGLGRFAELAGEANRIDVAGRT